MYHSQSMFLPPLLYATYKGQTNEFGLQSLTLNFYLLALLDKIIYVPIFNEQK